MSDNFDLDNIINYMNLTGQHQPTSTLNISDTSLNIKILDDVILSSDDAPVTPPPHIDNIDDLIDVSNNFFGSINSGSPPFLNEHDVITKLISTSIDDMPRQNTIEDTMEQMTLDSPTTDNLSSAICVEMGSSPVERKETDHKRFARGFHQIHQRTEKNSRQRKSFGYNTSSSSVGPIDVLSSCSGCQPYSAIDIPNEFDYDQQLLQFDSFDSKRIRISSQPRKNFRPRTESESKISSLYLRCDSSSPFNFPTIEIPFTWMLRSVKNIIEVTLVRSDKEPHLYRIDNESCSSSYNSDALIFRQNDSHTLYFCVTDDDFNNGYKSFMIDYIKSQPNEAITEELIQNLQLEQSMLRFTRYYQNEKNDFQRDEGSVTYSIVMKEVYGDIAVEHMGPKYGLLNGNERVYCLLKGEISKDDLTVFLAQTKSGWCQQIPFTKSANTIYFLMPKYPFPSRDKNLVNIIIYYKGIALFQSTYLYKGSLDQDLAELSLNESTSSNDNSTTSNAYELFDYLSGTGVCPVILPTKKPKPTKRLAKK